MKKNIILAVLSIFTASVLFTSCSKKQQLDPQTQAALDLIEQENLALQKAVSSSKSADGKSIDFDLTKMNGNMVYAQIFNLMMDPDSYKDKVFRMKGNFLTVPGPDGKPTYAVIVKDAQACCQQGIEFKYDFGNKTVPEDAAITVTGKYTVITDKNGFSRNFITADSVEL